MVKKVVREVIIALLMGFAIVAFCLWLKLSVPNSISLGGVAVAIWQAIIARLAAEPATEVARIQIGLHKAAVTAATKAKDEGRVEATYDRSRATINLVNVGSVDVMDVVVDHPSGEHTMFHPRLTKPLPTLRAKQEAPAFIVVKTALSHPTFDVTVHWTGPDGNSYQSTSGLNH